MSKNKNIKIIKNNIKKISLMKKLKYKEAKNKRDKDRYNKMTDEEKPTIRAKTKKKRLSKTI